jgi:hypothetical protein
MRLFSKGMNIYVIQINIGIPILSLGEAINWMKI